MQSGAEASNTHIQWNYLTWSQLYLFMGKTQGSSQWVLMVICLAWNELQSVVSVVCSDLTPYKSTITFSTFNLSNSLTRQNNHRAFNHVTQDHLFPRLWSVFSLCFSPISVFLLFPFLEYHFNLYLFMFPIFPSLTCILQAVSVPKRHHVDRG